MLPIGSADGVLASDGFRYIFVTVNVSFAPDVCTWSVPPEHLARPRRDELRHLEREECALLLDRYLRTPSRL